MTISITAVHDPDGDSNDAGVYDVAFDNSYTANGYPVTAANFNRKAIHGLFPMQTGTVNRLISYDPGAGTGAGKLRIWTALNTEAAGGSDQSTITCRLRVIGPRT